MVAQTVRNLPAMQRPGFDSWVGKITWRREQLPTPVFLPGECHEKRSLVGYSSWSHKESDTTGWLKTKANDGKVCREKGMFVQCAWIYKMVGPLWKTVWRALRKEENRTTIWANNFTSGNISKGNENTTPKEICSPMCITSLSIIVKVWNNLSVHQWMNG